jgi:hypothetical protein
VEEMNDQIITQHFILWQLPVSLAESHCCGFTIRAVRPAEAGYEYDEHELAEELGNARQAQPLPSPVEVEPAEFEAAYKWFLS